MGCLSDPLHQANHGPARGELQHTLSSYIELLQSCPAAEGYGVIDLSQYVSSCTGRLRLMCVRCCLISDGITDACRRVTAAYLYFTTCLLTFQGNIHAFVWSFSTFYVQYSLFLFAIITLLDSY